MKDIKIEEIDEIINNSKSVVLIWAEGCKACEIAKEYYGILSKNHNNFNFYKMQFSTDILDFYKTLVPEEQVVFPSFLVFDKRNIEENNKYGFVGNVAGLDMHYLDLALGSIGG